MAHGILPLGSIYSSPSAKWARLSVTLEEKSTTPWITVVLKRDLLDICLWCKLRTHWGAIWEAEYPSGMELVTSEYMDTGWEAGMTGVGGTWVSRASNHCWMLDSGKVWGAAGILEPVKVSK